MWNKHERKAGNIEMRLEVAPSIWMQSIRRHRATVSSRVYSWNYFTNGDNNERKITKLTQHSGKKMCLESAVIIVVVHRARATDNAPILTTSSSPFICTNTFTVKNAPFFPQKKNTYLFEERVPHTPTPWKRSPETQETTKLPTSNEYLYTTNNWQAKAASEEMMMMVLGS